MRLPSSGPRCGICSPTRREMPGRRWLPRPAAPCRHGHHLRRLCGLARLLARPTHTDLNGAELESTVPGILPNLGANARVTPPAAASSRSASAAGSPCGGLGERGSFAALPVDSRGADHETTNERWMLWWKRQDPGGLSPPGHLLSASAHGGSAAATERDREDGAEPNRAEAIA